MRARRFVAIAVVGAAAGAGMGAALCACGTDPTLPGTPLGTFAVTGTLKTSSCGSGAPNPWDFTVKLSTDPGVLYWDQGSVPVSGALSSSDAVTMTSTATQVAYGDDAGATASAAGACVLQRVDTLSATLTPDAKNAGEYTGFTGTLSYDFSQAPGSGDCSLALAASCGGYAALPCSIDYDLSGTRTALPSGGTQ